MACVVRGASNTLISMEKRTHFYRAMELNMSIGSETMRDLVNKYLKSKGVTLKEHVNEPFVKGILEKFRNLCTENFHLLHSSSPSLDKMDISVLTVLILHTFPEQINRDIRKQVIGLRKKRNQLAHAVKAELENDNLFKETFQMIITIAKTIGQNYALELIKTINELRNRELVNNCGNLERVKINNEMFVVKLVESNETETVEKDNTLMIKIGMTKWVRHLSRGVNVGIFLCELKKKDVISDTVKRRIEEEYSFEEQLQALVLHMMNETRFNLCKWCQCLRQISPQLADLIENSNTDGEEIDQYVNNLEREMIVRTLRETFEEAEEETVSTDSLHIYVEQQLELTLDFQTIREQVKNCFPSVRQTEKDCSIAGLKWKSSKYDDEEQTVFEETPNLSDLTCEDFANYVASTLSKARDSLYWPFHNAFLDESISPKAFAEMTNTEMQNTFTPYLEHIKFGIGIQKELNLIQKQIKNEKISFAPDSVEVLRSFDLPSGNKVYSKRYVRCEFGHLLVPKHEFRCLSQKQYTRQYVAKEVIRFAAACINGRRNGTIHFGIKPFPDGSGQIIGIPSKSKCLNHLNEEIAQSIKMCFSKNAFTAFRCVRPVQIIPVEDDRVVIEVDVVPFSKYIDRKIILINFPPKGAQYKQFFTYDLTPDCQILPIAPSKVPEVEEMYIKVLQERERLEEENDKSENNEMRLRKQLVKMLTGGNKYITDEFIPIIVSGNISKSPKEAEIRQKLDIERAFASSKLILDFDNSVKLREKVEGDKKLYTVQTAEDLIVNNDISHTISTWVYCNGNEELSEQKKERMSIDNWLESRSDGVKNVLDCMKKLIPKTRAKVIFLLYQTNLTERDPIYEVARMAFVSAFRNQCIVIAETEDVVKELKQELSATVGPRIANFFHTGLDWSAISLIMNSVCRMNPDVVCKLPHCEGHFVEMTKKERDELGFTDIEIMSGEECIDEESKMTDQERKQKRNDEQHRFYRGGIVSPWNFYYKTHVGERDQFERHRSEIDDKLTGNKGEALFEIHEIEHHPGAGGSTLGKHLLWHYSQFKNTPEKAYRCCSIKSSSITEDTVHEIEKFRSFKEGDSPKPFIVLADNKSEDSIVLLKTKLHELAYKTGCPGKLFCLILIINRMPITYDEAEGKLLLKHKLSSREQNWFEDKYHEMESSDIVDVKTLIAFNVMRKSFDPLYMQTTVENIMHGVSKKERTVLKCLALVSSYESDHPVPENVFDYMMNEELDMDLIIGQPWGIAHSLPELRFIARSRNQSWNMHMSDAMDLLITKKEDCDFFNSGVCLISQLLARTVLDFIKQNEGSTMESIVESLLDLVDTQRKETNPMSKRFVKIVCSLFKTRQLLESERGDIKEKFSDLILDLECPEKDETINDSRQRVLRVVQRCFEITEDAMVGQQLARFNIHIKRFDAAEEAITSSLEKKPKSSYLLDTYGQIFKSKMEYLLEKHLQSDAKISNTDAAEIIDLAFRAIDKFKQGQDIAVKLEEDTNWGCFNTEVKTALNLLEKFERFECFSTRENLVRFLNDDSFQINGSPLLDLMQKCPALENLRAGTPSQCHIETSLRCLEERNYQVKRELYTIISENETLLLKLRERFERFYGSRDSTTKYQFTYGIGLKPLMVAKEKEPKLLRKRVTEARNNLASSDLKHADERDLLVYLGDKIITLSSRAGGKDANECSPAEYRTLLSYSNSLVSVQTVSPRSKRLYLETYLYHAMLHWPLKSRTDLDLDVLARPSAYELLIKQWEDAYNKNFYIKSTEQHRKYRPKNYFALGKGTPGNDIVDLESIRKEWMNRKKSSGRVRKPVLADNFWRESFVEERLERLEGTVDGSGHVVVHKAQYPFGTHTFRINTYYPCTGLSNRVVTFVLGFTWKGPTAFDVEEKGKTGKRHPHSNDSGPSSLVSECSENENNLALPVAAEELSPQNNISCTSRTTRLTANGDERSKEKTKQNDANEPKEAPPESGSDAARAEPDTASGVQPHSRRKRRNRNKKK